MNTDVIIKVAKAVARNWRGRFYGTILGEDDLFTEAYIVGMKVAPNHDPAKSALTTWLFTCCNRRMIDLLRAQTAHDRRKFFAFREAVYQPERRSSDDPAVSAAIAAFKAAVQAGYSLPRPFPGRVRLGDAQRVAIATWKTGRPELSIRQAAVELRTNRFLLESISLPAAPSHQGIFRCLQSVPTEKLKKIREIFK